MVYTVIGHSYKSLVLFPPVQFKRASGSFLKSKFPFNSFFFCIFDNKIRIPFRRFRTIAQNEKSVDLIAQQFLPLPLPLEYNFSLHSVFL